MKKILITGLPGVGKTTLIKKTADALARFGPVGFYTKEIREGGSRKGFEMIALDGRRGTIAHVGNRKSPFKVGKYGVDVPGFEGFLREIEFLAPGSGPIIIDEIGKMECYSRDFEDLIEDIFDSERLVVATVARKGGGLISSVKKKPDVTVLEITRANRDSLVSHVLEIALEELTG
ncbi:MAG: NTPase [Candidatus Latescibacterota bacterium]|nr:MAG: NTPase [Candidatus Latescibacterota bacterium]